MCQYYRWQHCCHLPNMRSHTSGFGADRIHFEALSWFVSSLLFLEACRSLVLQKEMKTPQLRTPTFLTFSSMKTVSTLFSFDCTNSPLHRIKWHLLYESYQRFLKYKMLYGALKDDYCSVMVIQLTSCALHYTSASECILWSGYVSTLHLDLLYLTLLVLDTLHGCQNLNCYSGKSEKKKSL